MARIRSIKPEFWTSEQVMECSPNARLMFIGLWNFCDDAGRHPTNAKQVKAQVFPADDFTTDDVRRMFDELSEHNLISIYVVDGKEYFQVTGWHHQKIDKPQKPKYPGPNDDGSPNDRRTFAPDRIGEDSNPSEAKASSGRQEPPENPPSEITDATVYRRGKEVLGKSSGGQITKLFAHCHKSWPDTLTMIEQAATKADPPEWIAGVLEKSHNREMLRRGFQRW